MTRLLLLGVALLAGAGCTSSGPATAPRAAVVNGTSVVEGPTTCSPAPARLSALPPAFPVDLPLPPGTVLLGAGPAGGEQTVTGRVAGTPQDVLAHFRSALTSAGLVVGRDEDEGRSAQLTFLGGSSEGGLAVARLTCPAGASRFTLHARSTS
ncbi:MAG: hypothetical protein JWM64_2 [Frankiales bacterium]|nr:hypothetical protein [Frankiales bacterium]